MVTNIEIIDLLQTAAIVLAKDCVFEGYYDENYESEKILISREGFSSTGYHNYLHSAKCHCRKGSNKVLENKQILTLKDQKISKLKKGK